jgi:hypothetical protein
VWRDHNVAPNPPGDAWVTNWSSYDQFVARFARRVGACDVMVAEVARIAEVAEVAEAARVEVARIARVAEAARVARSRGSRRPRGSPGGARPPACAA